MRSSRHSADQPLCASLVLDTSLLQCRFLCGVETLRRRETQQQQMGETREQEAKTDGLQLTLKH
jgi:hypothetical protein